MQIEKGLVRKDFKKISLELLGDFKTTINFAKNDFKKKYAGSFLGITWAFVQPSMTIIVFWIVFQFGLKVGPVSNTPFLLWFLPGIITWFLFSDIINGAMPCLFEYNFLVKKVVFKIEILPFMKALVALFIHLFFVVLLVIIYYGYGYYPTLYYLQVFYYILCNFILALAIAYLCCAIIVFFQDFGQIVSICLQFFMWLTPIVWSPEIVPARYKWIFEMNPIFYFVQGIRDSLINNIWFWQKPTLTLFFWVITLIIFVIGWRMFRKLKTHFADML